MDLKALEAALNDKIPPVAQWHPQNCGEIDIRIDRDGRWFHEGSEIKRPALVKLFCSVLLKEDESYFLITPVEKMQIKVEMQPFTFVDANLDQGTWILQTKTGEKVPITALHPLKLKKNNSNSSADMDEYPIVNVRNNLWGHFHRNLYYRLVEQCELVEENEITQWYLESDGKKWIFGKAVI